MDVTVSVLKEIIDVEFVAMSLGIPMKRVGSKIQIICPSHNDKHFGSCYLTNTGYRCYSCGAKGDVIELVMAANKCGFKEACLYLADLQGVTLNMHNPSNAAYRQILDADSLELIGLAPLRGSVVYEITGILSEDEYADSEIEADRVRWIPYTQEQLKEAAIGNGYYIVERAVIKNPLIQLWQQDVSTYNELVHDKAVETKEKYCSLLSTIQNSSSKTVSELVKKILLDELCDYVGYSDLSEHLKKIIAKCDTIAIEHSTGKKRNGDGDSKKRQSQSIFKVKKGVSI